MQSKYIFKDEYRITIEENQRVLNEIREKIILLDQIKDLEERFGTTDIEKLLDEADEEANNSNTKSQNWVMCTFLERSGCLTM